MQSVTKVEELGGEVGFGEVVEISKSSMLVVDVVTSSVMNSDEIESSAESRFGQGAVSTLRS
jgi:hypothetical protein